MGEIANMSENTSFLNREEGHNVLEVYFADGFELLSGPKIRGLGNGEGG